MTEFWVSKAKHWCKYCKCWMNDSKMAITKHESGDRHKEAVARFVRNNREKKRHEEIEKAQMEKEMREIERKAREQFLTDVGIGTAKFHPQVHVAPVNAAGRMNVSSAFFPADANLRAQAPPPPPPKPTDRHPNESVFVPTPLQKTTTEDKALADELAKEGIVLEIDEEAQDEQGTEGSSTHGRTRTKKREIWWEYKPVEQDADKEIEELSKIRKPGSKAENKHEKVFGPFPSSQMVSWANEGYFSSGLGALVRKTTACGTFKISSWEKTIDFDSYELEMLFNGQEMNEKKLLKMESKRKEAEVTTSTEEQEPIRVPQLEVGYGKWETVRIINVEEERIQNDLKVKLMESQQKKYYEQKVDHDSDEEHNVFSGIRDDEAEGIFKVEEEETGDITEEIAKPGVVQFKRGREGKSNSNKRNFRRKTTDSNDD
uniref:Matrin-type domain-containing protein n=1 Tax=Guillardia theta TaxID=55529 RepID=A0A7S4PPC7_GUITH|mmetsp:Transcript_83/g.195  ORF Transcript_83/g.195 Transcript_83/m.195 type:complete len:430 (+) Transcript_83:23-1312(+)